MAPLALLANDFGCSVSGSDFAVGAEIRKLESRGIRIFHTHAPENISAETDLLIYSSAIPADNPERSAAAGYGIPQMRRGEFLALLARRYRRVVAVSGAHGKSSTTALLAHILTVAGEEPGFLVGAEITGGGNFSSGRGRDIFVTEVDESDGTHTCIKPRLGLVPNIEEDHAWSVGGAEALMHNYTVFGANCNRLIYCSGEHPDRLFCGHGNALRLSNIPEEYLGFFGFQAANAFLAVIGAVELGVPRLTAEKAARGFPGIGRRMTCRHCSEQLAIIEDYAHHPTEIAATLKLLRHNYPHHHLRVLIQPHRYARLEYFFTGFRRELSRADSVLVLPVFAAWSESGDVNGKTLADAIAGARYIDAGWQETAAAAIEPVPGRPLLLAVLGAGDIEQVFNYLPK